MQERKERTLKQRRWLAIGILAAVLVASALIIWKVGVPMLRLASEPEAFRQWIEQRGLAGRFLYVGMVFLQVMVAIIPGEPLEIVGGCAFGNIIYRTLLVKISKRNMPVFFVNPNRRNWCRYFLYQRQPFLQISFICSVNQVLQCGAPQSS